MADDEEVPEADDLGDPLDGDEDAEDLAEEPLEDDLDDEDEFEPVLDDDDDESISDLAEDADEEEAEEEPPRRPAAAAAPATDEEEDEEDLVDLDDVEADLDTILKDRLVAADDTPDEDEEEAEPEERGESADRLQPKRADEQLCPTCFLLVRRTAPSCPIGADEDCPLFG